MVPSYTGGSKLSPLHYYVFLSFSCCANINCLRFFTSTSCTRLAVLGRGCVSNIGCKNTILIVFQLSAQFVRVFIFSTRCYTPLFSPIHSSKFLVCRKVFPRVAEVGRAYNHRVLPPSRKNRIRVFRNMTNLQNLFSLVFSACSSRFSVRFGG